MEKRETTDIGISSNNNVLKELSRVSRFCGGKGIVCIWVKILIVMKAERERESQRKEEALIQEVICGQIKAEGCWSGEAGMEEEEGRS